MANCHHNFIKFNSILRLPQSLSEEINHSRNVLRHRVKKYFKQRLSNYRIVFNGQGSFELGTIINPIYYTDVEYDIDDGIYIVNPSRVYFSPATYHNWVVDAVDGITDYGLIDKNSCVRVVYYRYHIDLPIYILESGKEPLLLHKREGFVVSNPMKFIAWFKSLNRSNVQLVRIIRYLKNWSEYYQTGKMPSGFLITILAGRCYVPNPRDDVSFYETIWRIYNRLKSDFRCFRPTIPRKEDLLYEWTRSQATQFLRRLELLVENSYEAINYPENMKFHACEIWESHLGGRFPFRA